MVDLKEVKSVKIVPFTLMNASITAIMGFIYAIIIILASGVVSAILPPELSALSGVIVSIGISMIILLPVGGFLLTVLQEFITVLLYNNLVPKLGGIKLEFEGDEIKKVPVISFALIISAIAAIWAFIIGLLIAAIIIPLPGLISALSTIPTITGNATAIPSIPDTTGLLIIIIPLLIIGLPIVSFISSFIGYAIITLIYNYIVVKIGRIRLEIVQTVGKFSAITSIPVIALAIALSILFAIYGFIFQGIPDLLRYAIQGDIITGLIFLVINPIVYLVLYFIIGALFAILYNFLAPRIGAIELELE